MFAGGEVREDELENKNKLFHWLNYCFRKA
jgi:hypothetical protein